MRPLLIALAAAGLVAYPFVVYFLADANQPQLLVITLGGLLLLRALTLNWQHPSHLLGALVFLAVFCTLAYQDPELDLLKLYPAFISLAGAAYCAYSLHYPPVAMERIARRMGMQVPAAASDYLAGVTRLWLGFFVFNAGVACATAIWASTAAWTLYNGCLSYILVAVLLLGEWLYRRRYQRLHPDT